MTERDVNSGNYKLNHIKLNCICWHASHLYSSLILDYIGKSDLDGEKAGDVVDMNVVDRLTVFFDGHFWKEGVYSKDATIVSIEMFL